MSKAETALLILRQAVAQADWATVERYGVLNAALKKMNQLAREGRVSNGRGMIDDFRLWGSPRWCRKGGPFTQRGWPTWMAHYFDHHNTFLSEGGALAVVVEDFPGTPYQTRDNTDFPRLLRQSEARLRIACSPLRPA